MELLEELKEKIKNLPPTEQVKVLLKEYKDMQYFFCEAIMTHIQNVMYRVTNEDIELDCKAIMYTFIEYDGEENRRISIEANNFEDAKKRLLEVCFDTTKINVVEVKYWV